MPRRCTCTRVHLLVHRHVYVRTYHTYTYVRTRYNYAECFVSNISDLQAVYRRHFVSSLKSIRFHDLYRREICFRIS